MMERCFKYPVVGNASISKNYSQLVIIIFLRTKTMGTHELFAFN